MPDNTTTIERPAGCPVTHACEHAVECVTISEGGLHGGPDLKYMYRAQPGETLHVHFVSCSKCGYIREYVADGVYKVTRR